MESTTVEDQGDERADKDMSDRYAHGKTNVRDEETTAVDNFGSESWRDGPDTRAGG